MHRPEPECLAIYPNRLHLLRAFVGSIAFVILSAGMLYRGNATPDMTVILWIGLLFFGFGIFACGYMLVRNLLKHRPQLLLNPAGITFFDGDGTPHHLPWAQVKQFRERDIARQKFILIDVQNPAALIDAEQSVIRRKLMEYNLNQYDTPFNIAPSNLNYPKGKLITTLRKFHEKYRPHGSA